MNDSIVKGVFWKSAEKFSVQILSLIISIILARLLSPDDYGLIALTTIFISLANVFVTYGFGSALIQREDITEVDYSAVFYTNIVVSIILYILLYFLSPYIANFYDNDSLTIILRIISISILITPFNNVQISFLTRQMNFKKVFQSTLIATLFSSFIGVVMAFSGYGVWALITQNLLYQFINTVYLWIAVRWKPKLIYSLKRIKILFDYGWKVLIVGVMDTIYNEVIGIILGKKFSTEQLAFYSKGQQFPKLVITNIISTMDSVIFPALSRLQSDLIEFKKILKKFLTYSYYLVSPIAIGFIVVANPLIEIVLTDKWIESVPFLRLASLYFLLLPLNTANMQALKAIGRSDLLLKLNVIKVVISIVLIGILLKYNIYILVSSMTISNLLFLIIAMSINGKYIKYSLSQQIRDIFPYILSATLMLPLIFFETYITNSFILLFVQLVLGSLIYLSSSTIFGSIKIKELIAYLKNRDER